MDYTKFTATLGMSFVSGSDWRNTDGCADGRLPDFDYDSNTMQSLLLEDSPADRVLVDFEVSYFENSDSQNISLART
ncbi:hypothetical protein Ciccas_004249 [Cichlidogyrus casuarinus]|uniref:Uncharacterized protein n=1 Tax=Cichlidogyrus casuarinus TaxID=1844966 RepID=A0ABD2QC46_9PLAT